MPKVEICLLNFFVRQQIMLRYLKSTYYLSACKSAIHENQGKHKKVSLKPQSDERARGDLPANLFARRRIQQRYPIRFLFIRI